jgi:ketosteroid isomerase-like protein
MKAGNLYFPGRKKRNNFNGKNTAMNKLLFAAVLAVSLLACNNQQPPAAPALTKNNDSANIAVALKMFEAFNSHNWQAMANMYSDTALFKDPSLGTGIVKQSRQQTVQKYTELNQLFKDIKDSVVQVYPSGDSYVTVEFVSKGTAPDGTVFELPICTVLTIQNGLITKDFTYYDK